MPDDADEAPFVEDDAPHAWGLRDTFDRLRTVPAGLSRREHAARLARFGPNALPQPRRKSLTAVVFGQLRSPLIYLLIAAAAVSAGLGEFDDAAFILLVIALNTAIGAVQEARAESDAAALRSAVRTSARALRDGVVVKVDGASLVPGDIVLLEAGDRVPADIRILEGAELSADESGLTGESMPADKAVGEALPAAMPLGDRITMLHAGTTLLRGRCLGAVVRTGSRTEFGRIAGALDAPATAPPLTARLALLTRRLGVASLATVALLVVWRTAEGAPLRETFFLAVALAVSIIPEGLPVAVTVALSVAARRMARRNVIVRRLPAVEGLGSCTVVATDKTGTLTLNELTAKRVWLPGHGELDIGGEGFTTEGEVLRQGTAPSPDAAADLHRLATAGALCNDAAFDPDRGAEGRSGDTVDIAFLVLAAKAGVDYGTVRRDARRLGEVPFSAERRFAATVTLHEDARVVHVKGAAEVILPLCRDVDWAAILAVAETMAGHALRVLAVAGKPMPGGAEEAASPAGEIGDLTFYGLVGFIDPLRPEAREAVESCRRAGVAVKMITGDHPVTARAVARALGMSADAADVVTGAELAGASPARIAAASVFARIEPLQKVMIVESLQAAGHVVAMTGDGVNDAPALQRADLGIAMGRDGTDAARDAADLVLTDDRFASIVAGIEEGRVAYSNIRKVVYLLLSTAAAEIVLFAVSLAAGLPVPLLATQLLWLNLVTNGGQDVALALERGNPDVLARPPRPPNEPLTDRLMIRQIVVSGVHAGLLASAVFYGALAAGYAETEARSIVLSLMVALENVHVLNCRSEHRSVFDVPLRNNRLVVVAVVLAQTLHIAAPYVPGLRDILQVRPIPFEIWAILTGAALSLLLVMEIEKAARGHGLARGASERNAVPD